MILTAMVKLQVVVPNMFFREADEENFECNPEEFIRRDIEGSGAVFILCFTKKSIELAYGPQFVFPCPFFLGGGEVKPPISKQLLQSCWSLLALLMFQWQFMNHRCRSTQSVLELFTNSFVFVRYWYTSPCCLRSCSWSLQIFWKWSHKHLFWLCVHSSWGRCYLFIPYLELHVYSLNSMLLV